MDGLMYHLHEALRGLLIHPEASQAALFGFVIVTCWIAESTTMVVNARRRRARLITNALFAACALPVQIASAAVCIGVSHWVQSLHLGLFAWLPGSAWFRYGTVFVLLDFLDYIYHLSMHRIPLFWRFHAVHHTDDNLDVSTTVREHPGETLIRNGFLALWTVLTGAPLELLALRQAVETISNILSHTSLPLEGFATRWLGMVFITPDLHRVHHHRVLPYTDRNYGDVFSFWDRLFGTLARLDRKHTAFGLDTYHDPIGRGFASVLALPFMSDQAARKTEPEIGRVIPQDALGV
jgi:sterol desaturase/sphingolipid hydroxylase (fatty acid hydroxylase superfamily)